MIIRRIAAGLIGAGIILSGTAYATQPNPDHKITICHSGNGKHFTPVKVDYEGALGHSKTDSDDIIPAFPGFPGQGDQSILENKCEATTTTTKSTPTSTEPPTTSTVPSTIAPTTTTTTLSASTTTTTTTVVPETSTSITTLPPATTTSTIAPPSSVGTTGPTPTAVTLPPNSTPTPTLVTTTSLETPTSTTLGTTTIVTPTAVRLGSEPLPMTGSEPTGLAYGGLVLLFLGVFLWTVSKWT